MREIIISEEYSGRRVDRVLKILCPDLSKVMIFKLIRKKNILVNGKRTEASYLLALGDKLKCPNVNLEAKPVILKNDKKYLLSTLYEDDDLLVIDKESGIAVQPGSNIKKSLIEMVASNFEQKIYPVHRLDKGTSGCIIFAKNYPTARKLSDELHENEIEKYYLAGTPINHLENISIISNSDKIVKNHKLFELFEGKTAVTEICSVNDLKKLSIVSLKPKTGRKHQIRLHLAMLGCPILGDDRYGDFTMNRLLKVKRLMLHADKLVFFHPRTRKKLKINSKLSKKFVESIKSLDKLV